MEPSRGRRGRRLKAAMLQLREHRVCRTYGAPGIYLLTLPSAYALG
jgi:hypothetical protein